MSLFSQTLTRVRELIGGPQRIIRYVVNNLTSPLAPTFDAGVPDYGFLDRARRGKAVGLEISGLLIKPLGSKIASWALGKAPTFKGGNKKATKALADWWTLYHAKVLAAYEDSLNLADMYIVINPDLTVTILPPNVVKPIVDEKNFGKIVGWRVEITYQHPTQPGRMQTILDEYYADRRIHTVAEPGSEAVRTVFRNFIGRVPVVHLCNNQGTDEMFGRSEWEPLIPLLHKYAAVFQAAIEGNIRQGRPTPVISRMGDANVIKAFWEKFGKTRTVKHHNGTTQTDQYLEWDADKLMTLAGDATFDYKSPPSFTNDTSVLLGLMFYLFVESGEIPEGFLGSAIPGSRASLDTQMEPLVKFIEKKRSYAQSWLLEVAQVVLLFSALVDTGIDTSSPSIKHAELTNKDGRLVLDSVVAARTDGMIDRETGLRQLPLDIDDPTAAVKAAEAEAQKDQEAFNAGADQRLQDAEERAAANDAGDGTDPAKTAAA